MTAPATLARQDAQPVARADAWSVVGVHLAPSLACAGTRAAQLRRWAGDAHMGVDSVELVMDIERECDLTIPNEDAERLVILGEMHDYLVGALRSRGESADPDAVWRRLHKVLVETGIHASLITPSAHTVRDLGLDKLCQLMGDAHRRTRTS